MNKALKIIILLPAILFLVTGLRWFVDPGAAAAGLGMPLLEGAGLSTQVGDIGAFFLTLGLCLLLALVTGKRSWYYPPIMLLGLTAVGRILAWLLHDAALATGAIAVELVVAMLALFASRRLPERD